MSAVIHDTVTGKYISGWSSTGQPKLSEKKYAETMLRTAAKRIADNLNSSSFQNNRYVVE